MARSKANGTDWSQRNCNSSDALQAVVEIQDLFVLRDNITKVDLINTSHFAMFVFLSSFVRHVGKQFRIGCVSFQSVDCLSDIRRDIKNIISVFFYCRENALPGIDAFANIVPVPSPRIVKAPDFARTYSHSEMKLDWNDSSCDRDVDKGCEMASKPRGKIFI